MMIIAIDEAIPYLQSALAPVGEVRPFTGRSVRAADLRDAEALVVRSVTQVDARLLDGSSVRFVGTVTTGTDHLDLEFLRAAGIQIADAAGSNANAVSEWVAASLMVIADRRGWRLPGKSIGIIGAGHIGSLVEKKTGALGMEVLLCDPPLRESTGNPRYGFLDEVLRADVLTLHVPLTTQGPYPTYHMVDRMLLERLSHGQVVINSSRGSVVCGSDLKHALRERHIGGAILDVWEEEPMIDSDLLALADLGTPHIAGSSLDGKVRGTQMIFQELCRYFQIRPEWDAGSLFPRPRKLRIEQGSHGQEAVRSIVLQAYDILKDDAELRSLSQSGGPAPLFGFDRLRNAYALRPEFSNFLVEVPEDSDLQPILAAIGFRVIPPAVDTGGV
jgi:erythronate-4-phosphate dehydrogenase